MQCKEGKVNVILSRVAESVSLVVMDGTPHEAKAFCGIHIYLKPHDSSQGGQPLQLQGTVPNSSTCSSFTSVGSVINITSRGATISLLNTGNVLRIVGNTNMIDKKMFTDCALDHRGIVNVYKRPDITNL